jgi:HK97 family phage major capsid protein
MLIEEINARIDEIRALLQQPEADLGALESEITALTAERGQIQAAAEQRGRLIEAVAEGNLPVIRQFPAPGVRQTHQQTFDASSPEFKAGWLKMMARRPDTGEWRLGQLSEIENTAYTYTTAVTAVIPTGIQLGIVEMISKRYALLADLNPTNFGGAVEFQQATVIAAGKADTTNENVANANDLNITFVKQTMSGEEIKGQVKIGHKMQIQSIDGFEAWLVAELSREMGEEMNRNAFAAIDADKDAADIPCTGLDDGDIRGGFASMAGGLGAARVYANNFTIWTYITPIVDENGQRMFIPSTMDSDPLTKGRVYGAPVRWDETLADGEIYIGYPEQIKANMFEAPNVLSDMPDVTTREVVYGGYALFQAKLADTRAFVKLEVSAVS